MNLQESRQFFKEAKLLICVKNPRCFGNLFLCWKSTTELRVVYPPVIPAPHKAMKNITAVAYWFQWYYRQIQCLSAMAAEFRGLSHWFMRPLLSREEPHIQRGLRCRLVFRVYEYLQYLKWRSCGIKEVGILRPNTRVFVPYKLRIYSWVSRFYIKGGLRVFEYSNLVHLRSRQGVEQSEIKLSL